MSIKGIRTVILIVWLCVCSVSIWAEDTGKRDGARAKSYPVLGLVAGSPSGGLNAVVGYSLGPVDLRVSGGAGKTSFDSGEISWGLQGDLGFAVINRPALLAAADLVVAYSYFPGNSAGPDFTYVGTAFNLNLYGFFLETGLGINVRTERTVDLSGAFIPIFQIGYVHRFN